MTYASTLTALGLFRLFTLLTVALPLSALAQSSYYLEAGYKQQKPFLFEIEKDGKVSHILGSMHAGIPLSSYPEIVFELSAKSKNMAFEADAEAFKKEHGEDLRAAAVYPDGDSLDRHLSPNAIAKLQQLFDNGQGIGHLMKYRPWAIASELDSALVDALKKSDQADQWEVLKGIDITLLQNGRQAGKPITYLDDLSHKVQEFNENTSADDLEKLLSYPDPMAHLLSCARMVQGSYLAGDESGFQRYNDLCESENFLKRLQSRTISWVPKLDQLFKEGGAFVVVGVDHMNGPHGITALLTAKGYKVRRLNPTGNSIMEPSTTFSNPISSETRSIR